MDPTLGSFQRIYLQLRRGAPGRLQLVATMKRPTGGALVALLSQGSIARDGMTLDLVSDPTQDPTLHGAAATVKVGSVTAGDPGTAPRITNSGTPTDAIFDFVLPRPRDGVDGASAYQSARAAGYGGTETAWLASLVGAAGRSAYQVARDNGYGGTETAWLASLVGAPGASAYDLARAGGYGGTQTQWLASLKGAPASAYLGTITVGQTATAAIAAGPRRLAITIPASLGVQAGDSLYLAPTQVATGYILHDLVALSSTQLSIGLTGPLLAIGASFAIPAKLYRLN